MSDTDQNQTPSAPVDGYSDNAEGTVASPDPGSESPLKPLSAEERAKEEAEIRADGGAEDLKK